MDLYRFLKLGFLVLLLTEPIAAMEVDEENFGDFKRMGPEMRERVLSHSSLLTWSELSQTSKAWRGTIDPFLSIPSHHVDFEKHFSNRTSFRFEYSKSSFWVLAREYEEETGNPWNSHLSVIKIAKGDLQETITNLNIALGWSGRVTEGPVICSGSANPICFSPCPHGGVLVYAPLDENTTITFVNDSGAIDEQPVLSRYSNSYYVDMICGEKYIALNSKYGGPAPILFIPYQINADGAISYPSESDAYEWPRFQKIPDRGHGIQPLGDKFALEIYNGVDEFSGMPNFERKLFIDPETAEEVVNASEPNSFRLLADPLVVAIIEETIFPKHYKLFNKYTSIRKNNFLFLLGRLENPWTSGDDIYGVNERYRGLDYRKESSYPYGVLLIKNLKNAETICKTYLLDNTQLTDIQNESMNLCGSRLFITTYFRKCSTPKLTTIDIKPIKRLLLDSGI